MAKRKQIMVSLSGEDLEMFQKIKKFYSDRRIKPSDSEIMKMSLREYFDLIKKELGDSLDEHVSQD